MVTERALGLPSPLPSRLPTLLLDASLTLRYLLSHLGGPASSRAGMASWQSGFTFTLPAAVSRSFAQHTRSFAFVATSLIFLVLLLDVAFPSHPYWSLSLSLHQSSLSCTPVPLSTQRPVKVHRGLVLSHIRISLRCLLFSLFDLGYYCLFILFFFFCASF